MVDTLKRRIIGKLRGNAGLLFLISNSIFAWPIVLLVKSYPKWSAYYYSMLFRVCGFLFDDVLSYYNSSLCEELHEIRRKKGQPLDILEIGPGHGANLPFFPADTQITIIEKKGKFVKMFEDEVKSKYPKMKLVKALEADVTKLTSNEVPDASFDLIIGTHVFCCIQNDNATGQFVKRVLRPGGKFFSLEIVQREPSTQSYAERLFRYIVRPLFRFISFNCQLGTQLPQSILLAKMGFDVKDMKTVDCPCLPTWFATTTYGVAVKQ